MTQSGPDRHWLNAQQFVQTYFKAGERLIAPAKFGNELPNAYTYDHTYTKGNEDFDWVLIHKGLFQRIDPTFLQRTLQELQPVYADEVFVIFSNRTDLDRQPLDATHLNSFWQLVDPENQLGFYTPIPDAASTAHARLFRVWQKLKRWISQSQVQGEPLPDRLDRIEHSIKTLNRSLQVRSTRHRTSSLARMSMPEMRGVCRVAAQTSYLGNNTILCRVLSSYLLYGDTTDIGIVPHLAMNGCWEPALTMTMLHTLKQGWYCIDVGANHGYYSLLMASIVGKSGRVVAIEPNFKLAQLIRQSLTVNGFDAYASVLANAVSDKAGTIVKLAVPPGQTGHATIARPIMVDDEVMETETVTIDDLTADWGRVDYIKIDAEGAEEAIWRGMRQTLRKHRDITVILEFGMARYSDPKAFLQEILAEGFNLRYVDRDGAVKDLTLERCLTERTDRHWDLCLRRS